MSTRTDVEDLSAAGCDSPEQPPDVKGNARSIIVLVF